LPVRLVNVWGFVLALLLLAVGCQSEGEVAESVAERMETPAAPGSGQPRLYTAADGAVWMSWLGPVDDSTHALRYATLTDTSWGAPTTVATGTDWFVNWADLPSVRPLPGGRAAAHYLQSNGPSALAYAVRITQRTGGAWHEAVTPHTDGTPTEHGFVSTVPWPTDRLLAVWLDGRNMSGDGHGGGDMTLRGAVLDSTGAVQRRALIDDRTCECCATSTVRVGDEALVAYRDRSADEVRDIHLARFDGEQWREPTRLHTDGWEIEGCPVNGPALAARGRRVVAAWFTGAGDVPRVKAAFSTDGGRRFGDPVVVAEGQTKGRVDAVLLDDGVATVSWLGSAGDRGAVRVRAVRPDSSLSAPTTLATLPSASRGVGFPKVVRSGDFLYAAWVEPADGASRVRTGRMALRQIR
jgi:hypothetical protein